MKEEELMQLFKEKERKKQVQEASMRWKEEEFQKKRKQLLHA